MDGTVSITAANFGFGPASHAVSVARAVRRKSNVRILGVTEAECIPYLKASAAFDAVIQAYPNELPPSVLETRSPTIVVAVTDFERAQAAKALGFAVVVVDALYWMWHSDPIDVRTVDAYLCLTFPRVAERMSRIQPACATLKEIPQICELNFGESSLERSGVILNFGGGTTPFGVSYSYMATVAKCVQEAVVRTGTSALLIACSESCRRELEERGFHGDVRCLSLNEMIRELHSRSVLVTLPGLSIVWEALASGIPTLMIPGINYSQHQQVREYKRAIQGASFFTWDELPEYGLLPPGMDEASGVSAAINLGDRFAVDVCATRTITEWLVSGLTANLIAPRLSLDFPWGDFSGADKVAEEALRILATHRRPCRGT